MRILLLFLATHAPMYGVALSGNDSELPQAFQFTIVARDTADVKRSGTAGLNQSIRFHDSFLTSYLSLWELPASDFGGGLHIEPKFEFVGEVDANARICTELRAIDARGHLLFHQWELSRDARLGPKTFDLSGIEFQRSRLSSPSFNIPRELVPRIEVIEIHFRKLTGNEARHFPRRVHQCDVRMTSPTSEHEFEISFANPSGRDLDDNTLIAFECVVYDAQKNLIQAEFQVVPLIADGKRYRFRVHVRPEYFECSYAGIGFFSARLGRSEEWLRRNLSESWGVTRSGCFDGGKLVELPLEGASHFVDLPAAAPK